MVCCGLRNNVGLAETKQYHAISISTYPNNILHCTMKQGITEEKGRIDQCDPDAVIAKAPRMFPQ